MNDFNEGTHVKYLFLLLSELFLTFAVFNVASAAECPVANQCAIVEWNTTTGASIYLYGFFPLESISIYTRCSYLLQNTDNAGNSSSGVSDISINPDGMHQTSITDVANCSAGGANFVLMVSCYDSFNLTNITQYNISGTCT